MIYPENTTKKKWRRIKPKGVDLERKLGRKSGEGIVVNEIAVVVKSNSLNSLNHLLTEGGNDGRLRTGHKLDNNKWNYFPSSNKDSGTCNRLLATAVEREKRRRIFIC